MADGENVALLDRGTKVRFEDAKERAKYEWVLPDELPELGATPQLIAAIREANRNN